MNQYDTRKDLNDLILAQTNLELPAPTSVPTVAQLQRRLEQRRNRRLGAVICIIALVGIGVPWFSPEADLSDAPLATNPDARPGASLATTTSPVNSPKESFVANAPSGESQDSRSLWQDPFSVAETWTEAVPVWYPSGNSQEFTQGWQLLEFRRPIDPRALNDTERDSIYRVLYDQPNPPGPRL